MADREPTAAEVRAWMDQQRRGHAAAAKHFRALGYEVTPERCRELYREGGAAGARKGSRARVGDAGATSAGGDRGASDGRTADPAARTEPEPPPQLPATLPKGPPPKPDSLEWWEAELAGLQLRRMQLPVKEGQAFAQISRSIQAAAAKVSERQAERDARDATRMSAAERLKRIRDQAATWPEAALEVVVEEYLRRKGFRLYDPRDGGRVLPSGNEPGPTPPTGRPDLVVVSDADDEDES
jgi:hypothetical protein